MTLENGADPSRFYQKAKVLEPDIVKINKPKFGICQPLHKSSVNFTVGEAAFPANLEWGRSDKCSINYSDRSSDSFTVDKNMHECMAPD